MADDMSNTASTCTACGSYQAGLQGSLTIGASIGASLKSKFLGIDNTLFGVKFAVRLFPNVDERIAGLLTPILVQETQTPIAGFCQGFGLQGAACLAG